MEFEISEKISRNNWELLYTIWVNVRREEKPFDGRLQSLGADTFCELEPEFNPDHFDYNCTIPHQYGSVRLYAVPMMSHGSLLGFTRSIHLEDPIVVEVDGGMVELTPAMIAEMELNGEDFDNTTNVTRIPIANGESATIVLTGAVDVGGMFNTTGHNYTIKVSRDYMDNSALITLEVENCTTMRPAFHESLLTGYYCEVPWETTSLSMTYSIAHPGEVSVPSYQTANGDASTAALEVNEIKVGVVQVTAHNGVSAHASTRTHECSLQPTAAVAGARTLTQHTHKQPHTHTNAWRRWIRARTW